MENVTQESLIRRVFSKELGIIITTLSLGYGVFNFVASPQQANKEQIAYLKAEVEKNQLLNETLTKTQQNDLHTLEGKLNTLAQQYEGLQSMMIQIKVTLEERLPPKRI